MSTPIPPKCPECEEKIILNGGSASAILTGNAALLEKTCTQIYRQVAGSPHPFTDPLRLVELANEIEDDALALQEKIFAFQKEFLVQIGFTGPFPTSMGG